MHFLSIFILLMTSLFSPGLISNEAIGEDPPDMGTLIVSYHVDSLPDRLNRIRFLLISDLKESLYPKGNAYVDNEEGSSRIVAIENLPVGSYKIQFLIPNADDLFEEIPEKKITISKNSVLHIDQNIPVKENMFKQRVWIPAGKSMIGDPDSGEKINELGAKTVMISTFGIGVYEVTNAQYALWLSKALKAEKITYTTEGENKGIVFDLDGNLLFKTSTKDPFSQILANRENESTYIFLPAENKDSYPVIDVSWYGAMMYCKDNEFRLPTEAEWEKAAGVVPTSPDAPLRKYRYGFSQNEIDHSWANYKKDNTPSKKIEVLTTPVGFYNGSNPFFYNGAQHITHLALSPCGAFDMSGNVWEWVSDWFDSSYYKNMSDKDPKGPPTGTSKVAKGGCYDSLPDGVRVTERIGLPPNHADIYTGFRIAIDPK